MAALEIRGFGKLSELFKKRAWSFPYYYELHEPMTGSELLAKLSIEADQVEVFIVNGHVQPPDKPVNPGDRVALVPPGTPGPYRVLLGFVNRSQTPGDETGDQAAGDAGNELRPTHDK